MTPEWLSRADLVHTASCPVCGAPAIDVDELEDRVNEGTAAMGWLLSQMVGHMQDVHPALVEVFVETGEDLGILTPDPEGV